MVPSRYTPLLALVPLLWSRDVGLASVMPAATPAPQTGRIVGKVEVSSALASRRPRFRIYADAGPGAVPPAQNDNGIARELRNVVVYLAADSPDARALASAGRGAMTQRSERFEPRVLAVVQGTRVDFPNDDEVYHNVFSLSSTRAFDLGRYPKGDTKSVLFEKRGVVQVFCHIHSDMSGVVLVLPNRFFAAPDSAGEYSIDGVPAGEYTIVGWHERAKPVSRKIRVVAGETTTINFRLPLGSDQR